MKPVDAVLELLHEAGAHRYGGEPVSQIEHALQCAHWAEVENATDELVVAALLHDFGHLLHELGDDAAQRGVNDKHEIRALHLLRRYFDNAVLEPIRLHVDAKRYLCCIDAAYYNALSPASKRSLSLQGGPFDIDRARRFIMQPYGRDAARLRTWDDRAKTPNAATPPLAHFAQIMARCVL
jgi:phosphonate degradation associated HDIG domain protein